VIAAFGERARRWAAGARVDDDVIAADESAFLEAVAEGVRRRMRGETFAVALFLNEDPNRFVREWGAKLLGAAKTFDDRRSACASIATGTFVIDGRRQPEMSGVSADTFALGRALWHLGDRGVVVSEAAYGRLAALYARWHGERVFAEQDDPEVPRPAGERDEPGQVVVWAGSRRADEIAVLLCALEELHLPVYAVCDGGSVPRTIHRCSIAHAEPLLRSAAAILDATEDAPGTAIALARFGAPLAVARTSGAQEFLDGVAGYDGWNRDSVLAATLEALGGAPPSLRFAPGPKPRAAPAAVRERAPLVSVIVLTRDRRELLTCALQSVAHQTYPKVETIVVNDGSSVRDIAEGCGVVLVEREDRIGHAEAWNEGIARSHGEFIAFLDDDDLFFPDHLSSLVDAAVKAGAFALHSDSLMAHRGEGMHEFVGFSPGSLRGVDLEESYVVCPLIGMISTMVRRRVFDEIGTFEPSVAPNDDYEMIVRIARRYDWIHVDRITYLYSRDGPYSHSSVKTGAVYADLYEEAYRRHPFPDRPLLAARRRQFVEGIRAAGGIRLNAVSARLAQPLRLEEPPE
jgi:glycosyltransferase involved in cell wall biosynthesis